MLKFDIEKQNGLMRAGTIHTPHGDIKTPAFIGAATRASVKAITHAQMRELGSQGILANTYHLILAPGPDLIEKAGGFAEFTSWHGPSFTDSGGFQMLSLTDAKIDHDGVTFKSHINGDKIRMNPEISMQAQWKIGADIHMAFDQAIDSTNKDKVAKAMKRTHDWLPRNIAEHQRMAAEYKAKGKPEQYLYAVVQGGLFEDLRRDAPQEAPVVRDHDDRHLAHAAQHPLEPVYGLHVEVVRWLVEEQEVRARQERRLEDAPAAAAAGERVEGGVARTVGRHLLRHVCDPEPRRADDLARVGLEMARHDLHQSRLALAVAACERGAQPLRDGKRNAVQHARPAERKRHVLKRHQEIAHQPTSLPSRTAMPSLRLSFSKFSFTSLISTAFGIL